MTNPARQLLAIFQDWSPESDAVTPSTTRGFDNAGTAERQHVQTMLLIAELERRMDEVEARGRPMSSYRAMVPTWIRAVLAYPVGFANNTGHRDLFSPHALDTLRHLADVLDLSQVPIAEGAGNALRDLLRDARDLLLDDDSLPVMLRSYLTRLLRETETALDEYDVSGSFDLNEALERLWVGLAAASARSSKAKRAWKRLSDRVITPAAAAALGSAPALALQLAALAATSSAG